MVGLLGRTSWVTLLVSSQRRFTRRMDLAAELLAAALIPTLIAAIAFRFI